MLRRIFQELIAPKLLLTDAVARLMSFVHISCFTLLLQNNVAYFCAYLCMHVLDFW